MNEEIKYDIVILAHDKDKLLEEKSVIETINKLKHRESFKTFSFHTEPYTYYGFIGGNCADYFVGINLTVLKARLKEQLTLTNAVSSMDYTTHTHSGGVYTTYTIAFVYQSNIDKFYYFGTCHCGRIHVVRKNNSILPDSSLSSAILLCDNCGKIYHLNSHGKIMPKGRNNERNDDMVSQISHFSSPITHIIRSRGIRVPMIDGRDATNYANKTFYNNRTDEVDIPRLRQRLSKEGYPYHEILKDTIPTRQTTPTVDITEKCNELIDLSEKAKLITFKRFPKDNIEYLSMMNEISNSVIPSPGRIIVPPDAKFIAPKNNSESE